MPLREDGVGVVGAYAWVFDEGDGAVGALRGVVVVVGFVAVRVGLAVVARGNFFF